MSTNDLKPFESPIYVTRPFLPPLREVFQKLEEIWGSKMLTNMGAEHKELEEELRKYLKASYVSLFCNGTIGLQVACQALELKGDVITTPFTFPATITSLIQCNCTPIFCDINPTDFNINPKEIEKHITSKTSAIMPVHVFGSPCDVDAIENIASKFNLKVIYDAAHCFGIEYRNTPLVNFGDISMLSFHATKVFHTIEGGALIYNNPDLEKKIQHLRNFGLNEKGDDVLLPGTNGKMNEFQASIGLINLRYVDQEIERRKKIVEIYTTRLESIKGISIIKRDLRVKSNYQYFPILINATEFRASRDQVYDFLQKYNVFPRKYFYPLATQYNFLKRCVFGPLPIAERIVQEILCLPLYGDLKIKEVHKICDILLLLQQNQENC